jgi:hypothetical protein
MPALGRHFESFRVAHIVERTAHRTAVMFAVESLNRP